MSLQDDTELKVDPHHSTSILSRLDEMRHSEEHCDCVLIVEDERFPAHRALLCAVSGYFRATFGTEFKETTTGEVYLRQLGCDAVRLLLEYTYGNCISITTQNVQSLLSASCFLDFSEVFTKCADFLKWQIDPTNCIALREFANKHDCTELQILAEKYTRRHFLLVSKGDQFVNMSLEQLKNLIGDDGLQVTEEEQVFDAVMTWLRHDTKRAQFTYELLSLVRLPLLSKEFIVDIVESDPLIKCDVHCKDLLIEAMRYHLIPERQHTEEYTQNDRTKRRCPGATEVIIVVGGKYRVGALDNVEKYDHTTDLWTVCSPIKTPRYGVGVTSVDGYIYALGGLNDNNSLSIVECYDPQTDEWTLLPSMAYNRDGHAVTVLDGLIYAIGGHDGKQTLESVECFNPASREWKPVTPMANPRRGLGAGTLDGQIYAIGGWSGCACLNVVERFDLSNQKWRPVASMGMLRSDVAVTTLGNKIYAVGGFNGATGLKSAECYDPELNIWQKICAMNKARSGAALTSLNGCLYVVGGHDGSTRLETVERFDPRTGIWDFVHSMEIGRYLPGVAVTNRIL